MLPVGALADDADGQYWMGGGGGGGDGKMIGDGGGGGGGGGGGPGAPGGVWLPLGDGLDSAGAGASAGATNCLRSRLFPCTVANERTDTSNKHQQHKPVCILLDYPDWRRLVSAELQQCCVAGLQYCNTLWSI